MVQPSSVCVHVRACAQVSELGALSPPTLCPPSPGSQPSSPAALSQIGLNRQTLGICSWNGLLTLGPWGWDLGSRSSPCVSLDVWFSLTFGHSLLPGRWTQETGGTHPHLPQTLWRGLPTGPHLTVLNLSVPT